jgi:hypothetical protein
MLGMDRGGRSSVQPAEPTSSSPPPLPPSSPPSGRDPDFAPLADPRAPIASGLWPEMYLRLLANPFLALAGFVAWVIVADWFRRLLVRQPELIGPLSPILTVLMLAALFGLVPRLFRVHCLDCGRTIPQSRWREHQCVLSNLRRQSGRPRTIRGPSPFAQVVMWLWGVALGLILLRAAGWVWD